MSATTTSCGVCGKPVHPMDDRLPRLRVAVCPRCYGRPVQIRTASRAEGETVYTFYVGSLTRGDRADGYVVKRFSRRMTCTCPDYVHRGQVLGQPCKHVRLVKLLARAAGGFPQLAANATYNFRLADPRRPRGETHG